MNKTNASTKVIKTEKSVSVTIDKGNFFIIITFGIFGKIIAFRAGFIPKELLFFGKCAIINKDMKTGILGGTFNPVHAEHIRLVQSAIEELQLDKLIVMPTYLPPHKNIIPAPAEKRLEMLKIAFEGIKKVEVSDYEILKKGKSYTFETVERFRSSENGELYFICGGDMLTDFKTWRFPLRILAACRLAVFGREDFFTDYEAEEEYFYKHFGCGFIRLNYVGKNVSSTKIRVYSSFGLPITDMTGIRVEEYIRQNGLYRTNPYACFVTGVLPQKRLIHTANVLVCAMKKVKELGLSADKVIASATLHDCAKYLNPADYKGFTVPAGVPRPVIHAFLGAFIAENVLGITDAEVLDAIRYHTSGKAAMSTLGKLIFTADMIEEGRSYDGVEKLRELYDKDFSRCFTECLKEEVAHLLNKKEPIFIETLNAYQYYVKNSED